MSLAAGNRLGPYEIQAAIGAGGMGEVYKARDTRLDRTVAIKVLPTELGADPERRARFEREARAIAALNHPHICTLHDIGTHPSADSTSSPQAGSGRPALFLVMEYLAGESLEERLLRGPLPLGQALDLAAQIADALDAAHKHGITHRDLKPSNVMLTGGGAGRSEVATAKLLDFGLAKLARHGERPAFVSEAHAVTEAGPVTARGTILGTPQYMAPEQLEGKEVDARTDLWALGAMLYEMVSGRRAFSGDTNVSLIGNIMNAEPPALATLKPLTPPTLDRVVKKCLAKYPDDRWDTAHDVADELRWIAEERRLTQTASTGLPAEGAAGASRAAQAGRLWRAMRAGVGVLALAALAAAAGWLAAGPGGRPPAAVTRSHIDVRPAERVESVPAPTAGGSRTALAIAPDGTRLAFVGRTSDASRLYVRALDGSVAVPLSGTDGAESPVFSPDGKWIAYWARSELKKIPATGGPATLIGRVDSASAPYGMSWSDDGRLVFGLLRGGLMQVSSDGGTPAPLTTLGPAEVSHRLPHVMPGSRWVLFTSRKSAWLWGTEEVVAQSLTTGERKVVMVGGTDVRYVPTGHLVYLQMGTLMARAFDAGTQRVTGPAVGLIEQVAHAVEAGTEALVTGAGQYAVSATGTLLYLAGGVAPHPQTELVAIDRRGRIDVFPVEASEFNLAPAISPDGLKAAVPTRGFSQFGLWIADLERGAKTRIVSEGEIFWPKWTPDGRRVVFTWRARGTAGLGWVALDSPDDPERFVAAEASGSLAPLSWLPGGRVLAVNMLQANGNRDICTVSLDDPKRTLEPFVRSDADEINGAFSPDGRWFAYTSDETGRYEVYIQSYPVRGPRLPASTAGGSNPVWHPRGRELFFVSEADKEGRRWLMSASFTAQPRSAVGSPRALFEVTFAPGRAGAAYDVFPDGERFIFLRPLPAARTPPVTEINLVDHWFEELRTKVPGDGAKQAAGR